MDDLHQDALNVWKLRLRLEGIKKKIRKIETMMEMEEFSMAFSEAERERLKKDMTFLRHERIELEAAQIKLEEKIQLPNPYLNDSN